MNERTLRYLEVTICLGMAAAAFVFLPQAEGFKGNIFTLPKFQVVPALGLAVAALAWLLPRRRRTMVSIDVGVWGLTLLAAMSWAANGTHWSLALPWAAYWLAMLLIYQSCRWLTEHGRLLGVLPQAMLCCTSVVAVFCLLEACGLWLDFDLPRRPVSLLGNRNAVATYSAIGVILSCCFFLRSGRLSWLLLTWLHLLPCIVCRTRAVWVAGTLTLLLGISLAGWLLRASLNLRANMKPALSIGSAVLLAVLTANVISWPGLHWVDEHPYRSSLERLFDYQSGTGQARFKQHMIGREVISDHLLLGAGPEGWIVKAPLYEKIHPPGESIRSARLLTPASDPLRLAVELGLAGLLLAGAILLLTLYSGVRALQGRTHEPQHFWSFFGLLTCLIFLLLNSLFDTPFLRPQTGLIGMAIIGALQGLNHTRPLAHWSWRAWLPVVVMSLLGLIVYAAFTLGRYEILRRPQMETLPRALSIYPDPFFAAFAVERYRDFSSNCQAHIPSVKRLIDMTPHNYQHYIFLSRCLKPSDAAAAKRFKDKATEIMGHAPYIP